MTTQHLDRLHRLIRQRTGIHIAPEALNAALRRLAKEEATGDPAGHVAHLLSDPDALGALIDLLVVPESWFFRDEEAFAAACRAVAGRTAVHRPVRILSVPCACGEEPYSLAMALLDAGIAPHAFTIDAMDVSPRAIRRAGEAVYGRNAFRTRDLGFRDRHFNPVGDSYALQEHVRSMVRLACGSLLDLDIPDAALCYDLVFCRNLLIYFDPPTQQRAVAILHRLLRDDGMLFTGYAEAMSFSQHGFRRLPIPRAFALAKAGAPPVARASPMPAAPATSRPRRRRPYMPEVPPVQAAPARPQPSARLPDPPQPAPAEMLARARLLADRGETRAAADACRACLRQSPDGAEAWFLLGLLSERDGDDGLAADCLRRAVYLDPTHYDALCHLALLAERQGDPAQAARCRARAGRVFERLAAGREER
ncbi:MAG TPA: CheR family methyltransferase [Noviherbaspirillum sp.]|uniref:CheR family methyltransferase n=1 Tax=Noviherbaspirillum sp. TaxID=1926288 RepID=UPI002F930A4C